VDSNWLRFRRASVFLEKHKIYLMFSENFYNKLLKASFGLMENMKWKSVFICWTLILSGFCSDDINTGRIILIKNEIDSMDLVLKGYAIQASKSFMIKDKNINYMSRCSPSSTMFNCNYGYRSMSFDLTYRAQEIEEQLSKGLNRNFERCVGDFCMLICLLIYPSYNLRKCSDFVLFCDCVLRFICMRMPEAQQTEKNNRRIINFNHWQSVKRKVPYSCLKDYILRDRQGIDLRMEALMKIVSCYYSWQLPSALFEIFEEQWFIDFEELQKESILYLGDVIIVNDEQILQNIDRNVSNNEDTLRTSLLSDSDL
jgi:hypothetical protein